LNPQVAAAIDPHAAGVKVALDAESAALGDVEAADVVGTNIEVSAEADVVAGLQLILDLAHGRPAAGAAVHGLIGQASPVEVVSVAAAAGDGGAVILPHEGGAHLAVGVQDQAHVPVVAGEVGHRHASLAGGGVSHIPDLGGASGVAVVVHAGG